MEAVRIRKPKTKTKTKTKDKIPADQEDGEFIQEESSSQNEKFDEAASFTRNLEARGEEFLEEIPDFNESTSLLLREAVVEEFPAEINSSITEEHFDSSIGALGHRNVEKEEQALVEVGESLSSFQLPSVPLLAQMTSSSSLMSTEVTTSETSSLISREKTVDITMKKPQERSVSRNPLAKDQTTEAVRPALPLYPSLAEKQKVLVELKPLSRIEMRVYFTNPEARALEATVDHFVESNAVMKFHRHPLYIFLTEYLKSITAYEAAMTDLKKLQRVCEETREEVWKITDNRVSESGRCADNKSVTGEHFYRQCHLNKLALARLQTNLQAIRQSLYHTSFHLKCTAELARFQVECFLFDVLRNNPAINGVTDTAPTVPRSDWLKVLETSELRTCIGVLFAFHRIPLGSDKFRADIKEWLTGCVGILIRASSFYDQLFLLNHLLRCPSAVLQWSSHFIQLTVPANFSGKNYTNPLIKHFSVMLQCLLMPAKSRDKFLSAFAINQSTDDQYDGDSTWIVVDPDAEGAEELKISTTMDVEENDIFYLLKQFPFDAFFSSLFGSHSVDLEPFNHVTEYDVYGLFAFCHEFLELLIEGLKNPALNKYTRFNKKIAQIIREMVIHCKQFWELLVEMKHPHDPVLVKLRLNFEELVLRGMCLLLQHGRNGTLQFLVGWPTKCLSLVNLWRTVVMLVTSPDDDLPYRSDLYAWKRLLNELQSASKLQERLQFLDESDSTYLLTALAEIIKDCDQQLAVMDLVELVTKELLQIAFLGPLRTTYAKLGRDLVCSICGEYPSLTSEVLQFSWKNLEQVGSMGVFLFQEMPLKIWQISKKDTELVCQWLVNAKTIQDPSCLLARQILANLNWGFTESGLLFLPAIIHQTVAIAIVEAFLKFISTKNRRLLLYESLLRLSSMVTTGKSTPEQNFVGWCWEVLLELKLHYLAQFSGALSKLRNNAIVDDEIPSLTRDLVVLSPLQAVQQRQPMACYVAVMLTDVGHSTSGVLKEGLDWMAALVENYLYVPGLQILEAVMPLFFANNQSVYLLQQDQFHFILNSLLQADATYLRMVKNILVSEFPGKTLRSFGNMLIHQLLHTGPNLSVAVGFWTRVFSSLKNWNRTAETLYVLDQIVKFAFYAKEFDTIMGVLREAYEEYRESQPARGGGMTSLVSWITSGSSPAYTLIESSRLAEVPWLGYAVLQVQVESLARLWSTLLDTLTGEKKRSFEEGLKKAAHKEDVAVPAVTDLPIFQMAELIIAVQIEAEIFPLLCQEFFRLFLQRSASSHTSIGDQFFLSANGTKLQKPIKQKLRDAADSYRKKGMDQEEQFPKFFQDLQHAVRAFALWMDEPKLHHSNLYLPSLPPEYEPELLSTLLSSNCHPWTHFVDVQTLYSSMRTQAEHWLPFQVRPAQRRPASLSSPSRTQDTLLPPPLTYSSSPPFVPVDHKNLFDPSKVLFALRPDLTAVQGAAKTFVNRVAEHAALDGYFIELIAELNMNSEKHLTVYAACHKGQCAGPAEIQLKFKEFSRNDPVHRTYLQNREEWNSLVSSAQKIDLKPLVTSVVRFEKAITALVESCKTGDPRLAEVGAVLFYHMLVFLGQETDDHPLTRKFFHSCLEVLGQNFIAHQKSQCRPLLETCLNNQRAIPMLIPHFTPSVTPHEFLFMYKKCQQTLQGKNNEALIQLLSSFDVRRYLSDPLVDVSARMELLSTISRGISELGSTPSFQDTPLFEIYAQHIRNLVELRFPLHLVDVLRCLLDLTGKSVLPPYGWASCFFAALGISPAISLELVTSDGLEEEFSRICEATAAGKISLDLALLLSQELLTFFSHFRRDNITARAFGLLAVFAQYTRAITILLLTLAAVSLRHQPTAEGTFTLTVQLFEPWVTGDKVFLEADVPLASKLLTALRLIFCAICEKNSQIFGEIWQWYYRSYVVEGSESHVITAVNGEFCKIFWEKFLPDPDCLRSFADVTESGSGEAGIFLGSLVVRIPWGLTLATRGSHSVPFLMDLLRVFLFFGSDEKFRPFDAGMRNFIKETKDFHWDFLDFSSVYAAVATTLAKEPESLASWSDVEMEKSSIIAFLRLITQFEADNSSPNQSTIDKRALFLQILGRASVAYYTNTKNSGSLVAFILSTLKTVEAVWRSAEPQIRYRGYLALTSEIFSLSNYVSDKKIENFIRSAVLIWIAENPGSPVLVPMVTASCRCVINMESMVAYLEILIVSYFREVGQHDWSPLILAMETPELNCADFVKNCLSKQAFLTLHAHCLRTAQSADDSNQRLDLLQQLVEWCKVRPTPENQSKVFLLWNHVFILGGIEDSEKSRHCLSDFIEIVFGMAEEKMGLLSAMGVGKQTALSSPFKMVARSVAAVASPLSGGRKSSGKSVTLVLDSRNAYEAMKGRKEYAQFREVWPMVDALLASQAALAWQDVRLFFGKLLAELFPHQNYLTIICES